MADQVITLDITTRPPHEAVTIINQCDLPFFSNKSGVYRLASDIHVTDVTRGVINFQSTESVTLDLNGYTIDLQGNGFRAIVATDIRQLFITNGNIKNGSFSILEPVIIPPFSPIPSFPNITAAAIRLARCSNVRLNKLNVDNVLYGVVGTELTSDIVVTQVQVYRFGQMTTISGLVQPIGGALLFSGASNTSRLRDVTIEDCQLQSENGYNSILFNFVNGAYVYNVQATAGRLGVVGQTLGCFTTTDSSSVVYKKCFGRFCTQPFFNLRCTAVDIIDCESLDTNHNGIEFVFSNECSIQKCTIHRVASSPAPAFLGSGIKAQVSNGITITGTKVTGFDVGSLPTDTNGAGIAIGACNKCVLKDNILQSNNFGIKEILVVAVGPPPAFVGTPGLYLRNVAFGNQIQPYVGLDPTVVSNNPATANAWVNIGV